MFAFPRLLISAAHKSSGKTVFATGLCADLKRRGRVVYPFKKGPDYIDPQWLGNAAGRDCYNLDFNTQSSEAIVAMFLDRCAAQVKQGGFSGDVLDYQDAAVDEGSETIVVVEANKGLYDGISLDGSDSNAALAKLLCIPVILIIDCEGITRGIAPLLCGYLNFDTEVRIAGVVLNKVGSSRHAAKLEAAVNRYTDVPIVGCLPRETRMVLPERHLGLIPGREHPQTSARIEGMRQCISEHVDLNRIIAIAESCREDERHGKVSGGEESLLAQVSPSSETWTEDRRVPSKTLGIFFDAAFSFYYPDDFAALTRVGFELVTIDALHDTVLPKIDALFIGGGFPEVHASTLEANVSLRTAVREAIENGLPAYAECGGLMYLSRNILWGGKSREMVGVIQADAVVGERPRGRGYVKVRETPDMPWPSSDNAPSVYAAHEFHHAKLLNLATGVKTAYEMLRGEGIGDSRDGIVYANLLASFTHLRAANSDWPTRFARFVRSLD